MEVSFLWGRYVFAMRVTINDRDRFNVIFVLVYDNSVTIILKTKETFKYIKHLKGFILPKFILQIRITKCLFLKYLMLCIKMYFSPLVWVYKSNLQHCKKTTEFKKSTFDNNLSEKFLNQFVHRIATHGSTLIFKQDLQLALKQAGVNAITVLKILHRVISAHKFDQLWSHFN